MVVSVQNSNAQSFLSSSLSSIVYVWKQHWPLIIGIPFIFFSYLVYEYVLRVRYFSKIRHYPGPPHGHWLLGQAPTVIASDPGMAQLAWHKKYGKVIRLAGVLPGQETMSFNSYTALKTILVDKPYEFPKPPFLRDLLGIAAGYGLLTLEGPDHQALRRFMNQAFAFKYLHEQFEQYYKPINSLVEILETKTKDEKGKPIKEGVEMEVTKLIDSTLMDIICLTAFGYECDSLHNPHQPLAHSYHKLVNLQDGKNMLAIFLVLMLPFGPQLLRWAVKRQWLGTLMSSLDKRYGSGGKHDLDNMEEPPKFYTTTSIFIDNLNNVNRISAELLETKLAEARQLKQASGGEFAMNVSGGKVDVLSLLVRASLDDSSNYKMNSDMLQAQMLTFLGAGHETTASGAAWAMWELACNKDIQQKLRKECQELILRNHNPGWQELNELKYLNAVVQETMRVRPPTPQTARIASKDCTVDGTFVPKGTQLMIPIRSVNFDESIWGEDAREFKPERWFNLSDKYSSVFSVLTFIAGSHHCIGRNMAIQELKALLCALISRFEFEPAQSEPREKSAITMKPDGGLRLRVKLLDTR